MFFNNNCYAHNIYHEVTNSFVTSENVTKIMIVFLAKWIVKARTSFSSDWLIKLTKSIEYFRGQQVGQITLGDAGRGKLIIILPFPTLSPYTPSR